MRCGGIGNDALNILAGVAALARGGAAKRPSSFV
jgi:hypothetical protein